MGKGPLMRHRAKHCYAGSENRRNMSEEDWEMIKKGHIPSSEQSKKKGNLEWNCTRKLISVNHCRKNVVGNDFYDFEKLKGQSSNLIL